MFSLENLKVAHRRRQILVVAVLTFSFSFVSIGFSASNDTASSVMNTRSWMNIPINKDQQLLQGAIDGALNPEMIPNRIAYTLLFRVLDLPQEATYLEKERASSLAEGAGVKGKDIDQLLAVVWEFRRQVSKLDQQVAEIKDRNWPNPSPEIMDQLGQLQKEKETIVDTLVTSLPSHLGSDAQRSLHGWVNDHVKRRIKLIPTPPSSASLHHASLHSPDTPPIAFASLNLSAYNYLANSRPSLQSMGYGAVYSDQWVNSSWSRIWGCGVTEDYYNGYGHQYYVRTTLTSPYGRTASATSYTSSSYARVDVRLDWPLDDGDLGEYLASTEHWTLCPYIGFWVGMHNTQKKAYFGISTACYTFGYVDPGAPICVYFPVDGCNCKCFSQDRRLTPPPNETCAANPWLVERVKWMQPVRNDGTKEPVQCAPNPHYAYAGPYRCYDCFDIGTIPP